jgi:NADPH:quinone reductase-like Zn-dependent oxidoreductase
MKCFELGDQTGIGGLRATTRPDPEPGPGQALLRVRAVCLNHRDLLIASGKYGPRKPENRIPVSDGVGDVIALGDGVSSVAIGDRVVCGHFVSWLGGAFAPSVFAQDLGVNLDGWLAEKIVVPAAALVRVPDSLPDSHAAPLCAAGLTAWNGLVEVGGVKAGDLVLLLGTGGVSILALQFAKLHGARVAITSSSDDKLARARALGADILINYRAKPDWAAALLAETGGVGADIILETGGLATLTHSIAAAGANARIVLIGALAGMPVAVPPNFSSIVGKNLVLRGITAGSRAMLADLVRGVAGNGVAPMIGARFSFADVPAAYAALHAGAVFGKVLITMI